MSLVKGLLLMLKYIFDLTGFFSGLIKVKYRMQLPLSDYIWIFVAGPV